MQPSGVQAKQDETPIIDEDSDPISVGPNSSQGSRMFEKILTNYL